MFYIATPNWNYGRFLGDAIVSVRRQAESVPVRHHVQDALSTDNTEQVLAEQAWPGLSAARERDSGMSDALNRAFARVPPEVEFLGWLNSDEFYLPTALAQVRQVFASNPEADVVYGDSLHVDVSGRLLRLVAQHGFSRTTLRSMRHLYIQSSSTFFRRRVWESGELRLDPDHRQAMDHELLVRLDSTGFRFAYCPSPLSGFRIHDQQLTRQNGRSVAEQEFRGIAERFGYTPRPWVGRLAHRVHKIAGGAYLREVRARSERGSSQRWFDDTPAVATAPTTARVAEPARPDTTESGG
jgi:glycosyltransferase involved in cell wall biosynthesis